MAMTAERAVAVAGRGIASAESWRGPWALVRAMRRARACGAKLAVIDVTGGLGNQLFCYAFGRHLESRGFVPLYEIRRLRPGFDYMGREYRLQPLAPWTIELPENRWWRGMLWRLGGFNFFVDQPEFTFTEYPADRHAVFTGYWQHARYTEATLVALRAALEQVRIDQAALGRPGIILGARRGDYAAEEFRGRWGVLRLDYFAGALRAAPTELPVYIFSDDEAWAEQVLRPCLQAGWAQPVTVARGPWSDWEKMALMSRGLFHVISNSTFHWWGAAASVTSRGCVAPEPWLCTLSGRCGILPSDWRSEPVQFD